MFTEEGQVAGDSFRVHRIGCSSRRLTTASKLAVVVHLKEDPDRSTDSSSSAGTSDRKAFLTISLYLTVVNGRRQGLGIFVQVVDKSHALTQMLTDDHRQVPALQKAASHMIDSILMT
jgi:hypothetical protein